MVLILIEGIITNVYKKLDTINNDLQDVWKLIREQEYENTL